MAAPQSWGFCGAGVAREDTIRACRALGDLAGFQRALRRRSCRSRPPLSAVKKDSQIFDRLSTIFFVTVDFFCENLERADNQWRSSQKKKSGILDFSLDRA